MLLTNLPNPKCCNTDNPAHLCPTCAAEYNAADRSDYLPLPDKLCLENVASYMGRADFAPAADPEPDMLLPPTFSDLLNAEPTQPKAEPEPAFVGNVPDDDMLLPPRMTTF